MTRELVERMNGRIRHRGPDDEGYYLSGRVGFGHRRLSIVDLAGGHQPMSNEDGTIWITYNGEVYNHAEYRSPLSARGHVFRTKSDTEAIVHLHEEYGADAPARLRGMFAYGLWNAKTATLTLARDRSGIKPMYYALAADGSIVFGSEIKAILASGLIAPELDEDRVVEYFALGSVSGERTLYRGINRLEPGTVLEWRDGRTRISRYWQLPAAPLPSGQAPADVRAAASEFWTRFVESVRITLMSDVPLGVFLSGGLDSSLIVAAMRHGGVETLRTFSVGFAEAEANELPWARLAAQQFGTDHHEITCDARQFFDALGKLTRHRDQPLTFSASIPLYFVSELARQSVKVVLTGEGSDELFAGYGRYARALANRQVAGFLDAALPGAARRGLRRAALRLGDGYVGSRIRRSGVAHGAAFEDSYLEAFADFDGGQREALLGGNGNGAAYRASAAFVDRELLRRNPLEAMLRFDQATYLEELLMKQDQMSMASSIESRVPFLDHVLVEWAATLPPNVKLRGMAGKALVRAAAEQFFPRSLTHAAKRGFSVPVGRWLRGPGRDMLESYLPAPGDPLLNPAYASALLRAHLGGKDHTSRLWRILAFQVWRRDVLGGQPAARATV